MLFIICQLCFSSTVQVKICHQCISATPLAFPVFLLNLHNRLLQNWALLSIVKSDTIFVFKGILFSSKSESFYSRTYLIIFFMMLNEVILQFFCWKLSKNRHMYRQCDRNMGTMTVIKHPWWLEDFYIKDLSQYRGSSDICWQSLECRNAWFA